MTETENETKVYSPMDDFSDIVSKYNLLRFFSERRYRYLTSYEEIIESDFVFTMQSYEHSYRKKGRILGLTLSFLFYDTLFRNFKTANKLILSVVLFKAGGELLVFKHLDELTYPLDYIYRKYYCHEEHNP